VIPLSRGGCHVLLHPDEKSPILGQHLHYYTSHRYPTSANIPKDFFALSFHEITQLLCKKYAKKNSKFISNTHTQDFATRIIFIKNNAKKYKKSSKKGIKSEIARCPPII
jgi:hypothetical protein